MKTRNNSLFIAIGQVFSFSTNFLSFIIIARILTLNDFSIFSIQLSILSISAKILEFGSLNIALKKYTISNNSFEELNKFLKIRLFASLLSAFLTVILIWLTTNSFIAIMSGLILTFNTIFSSRIDSIRNLYEIPFKVNSQMKFSVIGAIIENLTLLSCLLYNFYIYQQSSLIIVCAIYGFSGLLGFFYLIKQKNIYYSKFKIDFNNFYSGNKTILLKSLPVVLWGLLSILYQQVDIFFLNAFGTANNISNFSVAQRLSIPLIFICLPIHHIFYPQIIKSISQSDVRNNELLSSVANLYILIPLFIFSLCYYHSSEIIVLLFGNKFAEATLLFGLLLFNQVFVFFIFLISDILVAEDMQIKVTLSIIVMLIINCFIDIFTLSFNPLLIVGIAKIASAAVGSVMLYKVIHFKFDKFNISFFKIALIFFTSMGMGYLIKDLNMYYTIPISIVTFFIITLMVKVFSQDQRQSLIQIIKS